MSRVALITGASRGIGAATARRLAADGLDVGVNYFARREEADRVAQDISETGRRAFAVRADVSRPADVECMVADVAREFGRLDVLVNNAEVYERTTLDRLTAAEWDRRLAVNLSGAFYAAKAAVTHLRAAGGGRIVNVTSQLAFKGSEHGANYVAAKAGIVGLTKALALELAPDGILVNEVAPGRSKRTSCPATRQSTANDGFASRPSAASAARRRSPRRSRSSSARAGTT